VSNDRVLVIEHEAQCPPGWIGESLTEAGVRLDVRRPYRGDPLPDDLSEHCAMVVLGGSTDAYADDEHWWLAPTKQLIRLAAERGTPTLGICLGHQLCAVALGGRVEKNPLGPQIGVLPVGWLPAAEDDDLFAALTGEQVAVQWNSDIVRDLPERAVVLARTDRDEIQVVRFGPRIWGVQTHPEVDAGIVAEWAEHDRAASAARGLDVDECVAGIAAARTELRASCHALATRFAELSREVVTTW